MAKRRKNFGHSVKLIAATTVLATSLMGVGYAYWSDSIYISTKIETAKVELGGIEITNSKDEFEVSNGNKKEIKPHFLIKNNSSIPVGHLEITEAEIMVGGSRSSFDLEQINLKTIAFINDGLGSITGTMEIEAAPLREALISHYGDGAEFASGTLKITVAVYEENNPNGWHDEATLDIVFTKHGKTNSGNQIDQTNEEHIPTILPEIVDGEWDEIDNSAEDLVENNSTIGTTNDSNQNHITESVFEGYDSNSSTIDTGNSSSESEVE